MSLTIILDLLKRYWPVLLVLTLAAALYFIGDHNGYQRRDMQAKQADVQRQLDEQKRLNAWHDLADKASRDYENGRIEQDAQMADIQEELQDAIRKNATYRTCRAVGIVSLYSRAVTGSAKP